MQVTVELTYDMAKAAGTQRFTLDDVPTVAKLIEAARDKVGPAFEAEVRTAAVSVNGVLTSHRRGMRTRLADGDIVSFIKAAAGG